MLQNLATGPLKTCTAADWTTKLRPRSSPYQIWYRTSSWMVGMACSVHGAGAHPPLHAGIRSQPYRVGTWAHPQGVLRSRLPDCILYLSRQELPDVDQVLEDNRLAAAEPRDCG